MERVITTSANIGDMIDCQEGIFEVVYIEIQIELGGEEYIKYFSENYTFSVDEHGVGSDWVIIGEDN